MEQVEKDNKSLLTTIDGNETEPNDETQDTETEKKNVKLN